MKRKTHRRPYWRETKRLAVLTLVPAAVALIVSLFAPSLDGETLLGLPLGYFLALHGGIVLCLVAVGNFAIRQDETDQWHGAQEDL
jgi:putative solute:sodium symporter small subunit